MIELCSLVSADEVAAQLGEVLNRDVKAQPLPREAWAGVLEQMGFPNGQTWGFEEMFEALNSGWINFGVQGTERVEGATPARDVFAAAQEAAKKSSLGSARLIRCPAFLRNKCRRRFLLHSFCATPEDRLGQQQLHHRR